MDDRPVLAPAPQPAGMRVARRAAQLRARSFLLDLCRSNSLGGATMRQLHAVAVARGSVVTEVSTPRPACCHPPWNAKTSLAWERRLADRSTARPAEASRGCRGLRAGGCLSRLQATSSARIGLQLPARTWPAAYSLMDRRRKVSNSAAVIGRTRSSLISETVEGPTPLPQTCTPLFAWFNETRPG
jgi:hypothetical protein